VTLGEPPKYQKCIFWKIYHPNSLGTKIRSVISVFFTGEGHNFDRLPRREGQNMCINTKKIPNFQIQGGICPPCTPKWRHLLKCSYFKYTIPNLHDCSWLDYSFPTTENQFLKCQEIRLSFRHCLQKNHIIFIKNYKNYTSLIDSTKSVSILMPMLFVCRKYWQFKDTVSFLFLVAVKPKIIKN